MVQTTSKFRVIKGSSIYNNTKCSSYGDDVLMVDTSGGIYLGNETSTPDLIANVSNIQAVDTGDIIDDVNVDYATKTYVDGLVGDINTVLESIINGGQTPTIITFILVSNSIKEYQAEEGMTFYDWGMSEYYDSSINLVANIFNNTFKESCQNYGNTATQCYTKSGVSYTPTILLNSVIQPITYTVSSGGSD